MNPTPSLPRQARARALLAVCILGAVTWAGAAPAVDDPASTGSDEARAAEIVGALDGASSSEERASAVERLTGLGVDAIPVHLAQLDLVHARELAGARERIRSEALLGALSALPASEVRIHTRRHAPVGAPLEARFTALAVLRALGTSGDLNWLIERIASLPEDEPRRWEAARSLKRTVAAILARDPRACGGFAKRVIEAPRWLRRDLTMSLAETGLERAQAELANLLHVDRELDEVALAAIGQLVGEFGPPADELLAYRTRWFLESDDPRLLRQVALCAGRMEDLEAVPALIALLAHEDPAVQQAAHLALERISGMGFPAARGTWEVWYEQQLEWKTGRYQELLEVIEKGTSSSTARAFHELGRYTLFRHAISFDLLPFLSREDARIRRITAHALGELGSPVAVEALQLARDDSDPAVREKVEQALGRIAGGPQRGSSSRGHR